MTLPDFDELALAFCASGRVVAGLLVVVFVECELVGVGGVILEVENRSRVYGDSHVAGFKVQVRTGRLSCVAAKCDGVACLYVLVGFNEEFREVAVNCFEAVGVTNDDIESVAFSAALVAGESNLAVKCCANRVAYLYFQVY